MVALENTHNAAGGTYYPLATMRDIATFARRRCLTVHLDGARLFNASIASGASVRDISACAETVTFCLSKGLGCPVGAMLCGRRNFIAEARRVRKMLGGGMRQAGIIAAAGVYALQHNVERLAEDHENARVIAAALAGTSWASLDPKDVVTNIIYFDTPGRGADQVVKALEGAGIRSGASGPNTIRLVTHLDVSREDARQVAAIVGRLALPA
jgi:threonine aldolase